MKNCHIGKHTTISLILLTMEEHYRQIWIKTWIESILHLLRQIDEDGVTKYFHYIGSNKNLTLEYINTNKHLVDKISQDEYFHCYISSNPHLTFDYVMERLDKHWDWDAISRHPNITLDMILSTLGNPRCMWDFDEIIKNPNITYEMLTTHEYFTENSRRVSWLGYCYNPNATFAELNKHVKLFKEYISYCPNVTLADVFANPEIDWIPIKLLQNPRIGKNVNDDDMRKLAVVITKSTDFDILADTVYNCLQSNVASLYGTPEKVKKLGKKCEPYTTCVYMHNPCLQISKLHEHIDDIQKLGEFNISNLLENDLAYNRDNFISTHISRVLLANMHDERSRICHATKAEEVLADEWLVSHLMNYV